MIMKFFGARLNILRYNKSLYSNVVDADTADFFAHKYQDLYTSVPFNVNDLSDLRASIQVVSGQYIFYGDDVLKAVDELKLHKADGVTDYLLIIFKKLVVISVCLSHFCCHAY